MKKNSFLFMLSFCMSNIAIAQSSLNVYSVYDVNHDHDIRVDDAVQVVNRVLSAEPNDETLVVEAAQLNALIESLQNTITQYGARIAALEEKVGMGDANDPANGHDYVDLGLESGTLWATCNLGANTPYDPGQYFAWGETKGYGNDVTDLRSFSWTDYMWCDGSSKSLNKYCTDSYYGTVDSKTSLDIEDDAARANWKGYWRIPTSEEMNELRENCTWSWDVYKKAYQVRSKRNGRFIYMPATGTRTYSNINGVGARGYYWVSDLYTSINTDAYYLYFTDKKVDDNTSSTSRQNRCNGQAIRPVLKLPKE